MTIGNLIQDIIKSGDYAASVQYKISRNFKEDGSVVTPVDLKINDYLKKTIISKFPDAGFISEEIPEDIVPESEYTFVLDPLDGTDVYSMGMNSWCISLGILRNNIPLAGIVYAPNWGLKGGTLFFKDVDGKVFLNNKPYKYEQSFDGILQIMAMSTVHFHFDCRTFPGKIRNVGSSVISILSPLLHSQVSGAILNKCYVWDIAAAHAIISSCGLDLTYFSGKKIDYSCLLARKKAEDYLICGITNTLPKIRENIKRIN